MDGEHFIAAPNCGTALCLASVNLFPSPKSDESPEAAFNDFDFEPNSSRSIPIAAARAFNPYKRVEAEEPPTTIQQKVARRDCLYRVYPRRPVMV